MSLAFSGPGGTVERRWVVYALLRDNIQHHLEGGEPEQGFAAIHAIAAALGGGPVHVGAAELRAELLKASVLKARPIADLALSPPTISVITLRWPPPPGAETRLASEWGIELPLAAGATTLGEVFGTLIDELMTIVGSGEGGTVEVVDC